MASGENGMITFLLGAVVGVVLGVFGATVLVISRLMKIK